MYLSNFRCDLLVSTTNRISLSGVIENYKIIVIFKDVIENLRTYIEESVGWFKF